MRQHVLLLVLIGILICFAANLKYPFYKLFVKDQTKSYHRKYSNNWDDAQKEILRFCQDQPFQNQSYLELTDEEYAIYAVTVEEFFKDYSGSKPQIYRKAVSPICQRDLQKYTIIKSIPTKVRVQLVDKDFRYVWDAIDEQGTYKEKKVPTDVFYEGYGRGVYSFSRVAFNKEHDKAYMEYFHMCGGLCGGSGIFVFIMDKGKWVFLEAIQGAIF